MSLCTFRLARDVDRDAALTVAGRLPAKGAETEIDWAAWLADAAAEVTVGEVDGEVVALGKVIVAGAREGWIELQRIAQTHRQQGLTLALTAYQADRAQKTELRVLRWPVGPANLAGQRVAYKVGFHRVTICAPLISEHLAAGAPNLTRLDERHYSVIQNWLGRSTILRASGGLYAAEGCWQELTGKKVHAHLAAGQVAGLPGANGGIAAFAILGGALPDCGGAESAHGCNVGYVDGDWQSLPRLALALRGQAGGESPGEIRMMLASEPTLRAVLQAAGFREAPEAREIWVYERLLT